jgi:hypothetical protein
MYLETIAYVSMKNLNAGRTNMRRLEDGKDESPTVEEEDSS